MGAFDDYLAQRSRPATQPAGAPRASGGGAFDDYLANAGRMSALDAGWRGVQDGLTFGFADEFAGLVGGDAEKERVRALQAQAEHERPGWYLTGQIGSAFVPFGGIGVLGNAARGALGLARAAHAAEGAGALAKVGKGLGSWAGSALGGLGYGSLYRLGNSQGDAQQRFGQLTPANAAIDAASGVFGHGLAGLAIPAAVGAVSRGTDRFFERAGARTAHDAALARAGEAVRSAEAEASAIAPYGAADAAREDAFKRMVNEAIDADAGAPAALQATARQFGVDLPRSMANGSREGKQWLWEAYDGVHGPAARRESEKIVQRLFQQTPDALMNVVDEGARFAPASAQEGASEVRARLQMRNEMERQAENNAWGAFNPEAAQFKFSQQGHAGLPTLAKAVDAGLTDRRVFFDHANPEMAEIYRRLYPRAALARDAVTSYVDGVKKGKPGTLEDVVNLRRFVSDAYQAARDDADRSAVMSISRGLDSWLETTMPAQVRQRGAQALEQFQAANAITHNNRALFVDNEDVRKMIAPEGDAERALSQLVGTRGVNPQLGAHMTMRALRERLGPDSDAWRTLKLSILRRLTDPLEEAVNRDNPRAFATIYQQLDNFLTRHHEFAVETFSPQERLRLEQMRAVLRSMQPPGPGASNPSRSGITAGNLLQSLLPGGKQVGNAWQDLVMAPRRARADLEAIGRPDVVSPTLRAAAGGVLMGPDSFWLSAGAGAANTRFADYLRKKDEERAAYAF